MNLFLKIRLVVSSKDSSLDFVGGASAPFSLFWCKYTTFFCNRQEKLKIFFKKVFVGKNTPIIDNNEPISLKQNNLTYSVLR